jgi:Uma2 family endonuclease
MVQPFPLHRFSYTEYRMLEESSSTKHEFLGGEIYAMAGGTPLHAALSMAVGAMLQNQLGGTGCRAYISDLRVRVAATGLATYPDVTVVCGAVEPDLEDRNAATNPRVVVEVLSDATEEYDRTEKLAHYKRVPSLGAVVLVAQSTRRIEVWQRDGAEWIAEEGGPGTTIVLKAVPCTLSVDAVYDAAGAP